MLHFYPTHGFFLPKVMLLVFYVWLWRGTLSFLISFLSDSGVLKRTPAYWCIIALPSWQRRSILNSENLLLQHSVKKTSCVKGRVNTYQGNIHESLTDVALEILSRIKTQPPLTRTKPKFTKVARFTEIFSSYCSDRKWRAISPIWECPVNNTFP